MLKERATFLRKLSVFGDFCILNVVFFGLYYLMKDTYQLASLEQYFRVMVTIFIIWLFTLYKFDIYGSFRLKSIPNVLSGVFSAFMVGYLVFAVITYVFLFEWANRNFIFEVFLISCICLGIEKLLVVLFFRALRLKGYNYQNIIIVGTGDRARKFIDIINDHKEWGLKIQGIVDIEPLQGKTFVKGYEVIGSLENLADILHNNVVDDIVFVVPRLGLSKIEEALIFCETEGVRTRIAVDYFNMKFSRMKQTDIEGFPMLTFERIPDELFQLMIKRAMDIVISFFMLVILSPFLLFITLMVKLTSRGPVLFKQKRSGLNRRTFQLYKFRTMLKDAEDRLEDLQKENEMSGPVFKLKDDPRITSIGKVLRKFSIDELPQLWNVLRGDMSLVGPRPPLPDEVDKYDSWHRRRLSMRPGLTCIWQVSGRNQITDFDQWIKLDLQYIDNWNLLLDIKILFKTIPVVLFGIGAK